MDPELSRELEEQIRELNATLAQLGGVMAEQTKAVSTTTTNLQQTSNAARTNRQSTSQNSQARDKLNEATKTASDTMSAAAQNYREAFGHSISALTSFSSALLSSEQGMAKYGKAAESLGASALSVGSNFGVLGTAIGGGAAIFGKVVGEVFKLNDNIINTRDSFNKVGGILPVTTTELGNLAKQARFSLDDMAKLSKVTNKLGDNLLGLGGYAGEGAVKFMEMANVSDDVRRKYDRLGVSQDHLLDLQAKYVQMQRVSGQAMENQAKTSDQLRKESLAYADNLIKMSSLTGESADQLQAERDTAILEYEEQVQIMAENKKIQELKDNNRFEEAAALKLEQTNRQALIKHYANLYGEADGQLVGRLMRQGAYDEKTAGLAVRDPNMIEFTQKLKTSKDAVGDILRQADKTDKALQDTSVRFGPALQYKGEELGKQVGLGGKAVERTLKRGDKAPSEMMAQIAEEIAGKGKEGADPLADTYASMNSLAREAKAKVQTFLERVDPMRNGFEEIKKAAIAAAVALGVVAAAFAIPAAAKGVKSVASGAGKIKGLFTKGGSVAAGAASTATGAGPLSKATTAANAPGANKVGGFLISVVRGLETAGKAGLKMVQGAGYLSAAIAVIGAGIAGATWLMGAALPNLARGLKSFDKIDGQNLKQVGIGMAGLGAGILAMGGGQIAGAISNVVNWFVDGEDPLENAAKQIKKLEAMTLDEPKIRKNSEAVVAFSKAMMAASTMGAGAALADISSAIAESTVRFFKATPPLEQFLYFSFLPINAKRTKTNATAFRLFSEAMASYKGLGSPTGAISTAIADAAFKFFKVKPPLEQFVYFSGLKIDPKKTDINAKAFVNFANAMSEYRGGPGLIDSISSLLGKGFNAIFGEDGPVEAFRKFSKDDFGPNASANAEAFYKYAQAAVALQSPSGGGAGGGGGGGGGGGFSNAVQSGLEKGAAAGAAAAGAVGGAISAGADMAANFVDWAKAKITGKPTDVLTFTANSGSYENFAALNPDMQKAVVMAATDYKKATGRKMQMNSGRRARADQERLWNETVRAGRPGRGPTGMLVADPNKNPPHLRGNAIDLQEGKSDPSRAIPILARYGLKQTYGRKDPVHFDLKAMDGGIFEGPDSGYPIEMHGSEMVAPLEMNSVLMKLAKTPANTQTTSSSVKTLSSNQSTKSGGSVDEQAALNLELYGMITRKLDNMIGVLENSQDTQTKLLRHARV